MIFPLTGNYSRDLLHRTTDDLYLTPMAAGAKKFKYSLNWGSSFSPWIDYTGANTNLTAQPWTGAKWQAWIGDHVIVNYWSPLTGSSDHIQHGGLDSGYIRRWPHAFVEGVWNIFGYDAGIDNNMELIADGIWSFKLAAEWPSQVTISV